MRTSLTSHIVWDTPTTPPRARPAETPPLSPQTATGHREANSFAASSTSAPPLPRTTNGRPATLPGPSCSMFQPTKSSEALRECLGLPDDARGQAMAKLMWELGYTETGTWFINEAARSVGPDHGGVAIPVARNPETEAVVVLHETPKAAEAWRKLAPIVRFAARFNWMDTLVRDKPRGLLILRSGAEPYHLLEEHFHHQFSRAALLRFGHKTYPDPTALPRAADSEAYAATMTHRTLAAIDPDLTWNGQADIAARFAHMDNRQVLEHCLARATDLAWVAPGSINNGDGKPNRPVRQKQWLSQPELDAVGIARFGAPGQLYWGDVRHAKIPWTAQDIADVGHMLEHRNVGTGSAG